MRIAYLVPSIAHGNREQPPTFSDIAQILAPDDRRLEKRQRGLRETIAAEQRRRSAMSGHCRLARCPSPRGDRRIDFLSRRQRILEQLQMCSGPCRDR
jgi:hypothetical protein